MERSNIEDLQYVVVIEDDVSSYDQLQPSERLNYDAIAITVSI